MPIYAYKCESCGHRQDVLQKISDPVLTACPACGAETFAKQVTAAGFQLKGSGWYVTDFRDSGAKAKTDGKAESKPESKPEASAEGAAAPAADAKPADKAAGKAGGAAERPPAPASAPAPAPSSGA